MRDAISVTTELPSPSRGVGTPVRLGMTLGLLLRSTRSTINLGGECSSAVK